MSTLATGDKLATLPTDKEEASYSEKTMLDALYPDEKVEKIEKVIEHLPTTSKKLWVSFREIIISTVLFLVLNLPFSDNMVSNLTKTENVYYRLVIKTVVFAVLFFVLTNFSLARV